MPKLTQLLKVRRKSRLRTIYAWVDSMGIALGGSFFARRTIDRRSKGGHLLAVTSPEAR